MRGAAAAASAMDASLTEKPRGDNYNTYDIESWLHLSIAYQYLEASYLNS